MPVVNGNEIQTGVTTRGNFTIQYQQNGNGGVIPIIDGTPHPELLMGYASEADKQAGLELLAEALEATNGNIIAAMNYMYSAVRTAAEGIVPQKAVNVDGTEILINFEEAKAYEGIEVIANLDDMSLENLSNDAIEALLVERTRAVLTEREREREELLLLIDTEDEDDYFGEDW